MEELKNYGRKFVLFWILLSGINWGNAVTIGYIYIASSNPEQDIGYSFINGLTPPAEGGTTNPTLDLWNFLTVPSTHPSFFIANARETIPYITSHSNGIIYEVALDSNFYNWYSTAEGLYDSINTNYNSNRNARSMLYRMNHYSMFYGIPPVEDMSMLPAIIGFNHAMVAPTNILSATVYNNGVPQPTVRNPNYTEPANAYIPNNHFTFPPYTGRLQETEVDYMTTATTLGQALIALVCAYPTRKGPELLVTTQSGSQYNCANYGMETIMQFNAIYDQQLNSLRISGNLFALDWPLHGLTYIVPRVNNKGVPLMQNVLYYLAPAQ